MTLEARAGKGTAMARSASPAIQKRFMETPRSVGNGEGRASIHPFEGGPLRCVLLCDTFPASDVRCRHTCRLGRRRESRAPGARRAAVRRSRGEAAMLGEFR